MVNSIPETNFILLNFFYYTLNPLLKQLFRKRKELMIAMSPLIMPRSLFCDSRHRHEAEQALQRACVPLWKVFWEFLYLP